MTKCQNCNYRKATSWIKSLHVCKECFRKIKKLKKLKGGKNGNNKRTKK